jgi:hypothetical protein
MARAVYVFHLTAGVIDQMTQRGVELISALLASPVQRFARIVLFVPDPRDFRYGSERVREVHDHAIKYWQCLACRVVGR